MTAVLVEVRAYSPPVFAPDLCEHLILARSHRPTGAEDVCEACGWHWPCPIYFQARRALISAGVPPTEWA
jgi:hypothetical protein